MGLSRRTLLALPLAFAAGGPALAAPGPCERIRFEEASYTVCRLDLARYRLGLFRAGPDGTPYGSLGRFLGSPEGRGAAVAMNAGMYHPDLAPVGLYVEKGRQEIPANTANGPGNFHLKPNGVFFVAGERAGILETRAYLRRAPRAEIATQSGPLLVFGGRFHPRISGEGPSRKLRNGVGVTDGGRTVVFAITEEPVSFGAFARLFRDGLDCPDALFLDGSVSVLSAPGSASSGLGFKPIGPILAAFPR